MLTSSIFFSYLEKISAGQISHDALPPEDVREDLLNLIDGDERTVLITSEIMFRRLPLNDFYQNIRNGLDIIKSILNDYDINVILYVRHQRSFVESCYTQLVQMGRNIEFNEYIGGEIPKHIRWTRVCDDISSAIGRENLFVRPFEIIKKMNTELFIEDYLLMIGLRDEEIKEFSFDSIRSDGKAANRGFSQLAVEFARFTMPMLAPKDRVKLRKFLQENYSTEHFPRPVYFTKEQSVEIDAIYADDNIRLFEKYIPGQCRIACGY